LRIGKLCYTTYVVKGLLRNEIIYAKEMMEKVIRPMLMKLIEWKIGFENDFSVSIGKAGKFMGNYLTDDFYTKFLQTYSDAGRENNWIALFATTELFKQTADELSIKLKFKLNLIEQENTENYLRQMYLEQ